MIGVGGKAIRSVSGSNVVLDDGETTLCRSVGERCWEYKPRHDAGKDVRAS